MKLRKKIQLGYEPLSPQLKQAARYISENIELVATHSLRHVAETGGLSPPTLSRLARALGFDSYEELREMSRQDLTSRKQSFGEKAAALQTYRRDGEMIGKGAFVVAQAAFAIENIQLLVDGIDTDHLTSAAGELSNARNVYLAGFQSSRAFVSYLEYIATMAFDNWHVLDLNHGSASRQLLTMNENDVVISLLISPYTRRAVDLVEAAANTGAKLISVTDSVHSPICGYANYSFLTSTESPNFFASYVAPLVFLESLIGMVVRRSGEMAQERVAAVEQLNYDLGEYWSND